MALSVKRTCLYAMGYAFRAAKAMKSRALRRAILALTVIATSAAGMLGIKSCVECVLYGQPFVLRAAKNFYAFVADAAVMLISLPLCTRLDAFFR